MEAETAPTGTRVCAGPRSLSPGGPSGVGGGPFGSGPLDVKQLVLTLLMAPLTPGHLSHHGGRGPAA